MPAVPKKQHFRHPAEPRPEEPVERIVYASRALVTGPIYAEMERIRACAVRNNEPEGIHTALLHQSGWFVQWKEGPAGPLRRLMERVANDPRHQALRVVHASRGPRLLSGPWSMGIVQCDEPVQDMALRVQALERRVHAGRQPSPPAAWRQLSTPLRHPGADRQAEPEAVLRLMACSARGMLAFDLVRWLARCTRQELVRRRFAGAHDLDVGTDYVDFAACGRLLRVIAMARRGLALPLTRAMVPDYSHVLLLLSGDAQADLDLLRRVAAACRQAAEPPPLLAIAPGPEVHLPLAGAAAAAGLRYQAAPADPREPSDAWRAVMAALHREPLPETPCPSNCSAAATTPA